MWKVVVSIGLALLGAGCAERAPQAPAAVCLSATAAADPRGVFVPGGVFQMGSNDFYPEEGPVRLVEVEPFWMDATEVTNAQFAAFVDATGYVTVAERTPRAQDNPGAPAALLVAGSAVFTPPLDVVDLVDFTQWWRFTPGANWRRPEGPGSSIEGREQHPVVHVVLEDAEAYARWAGRALPSEAQWERAARGGLEGKAYVWGDAAEPEGKPAANAWQGAFPVEDRGSDGHRGTAPVGCFEPNGFGLYDMAGNVWEWTTAEYPGAGPGFAVLKGGSWLCAPSYCGRARPAARQPGDRALGTNHTGFRTVLSVDAETPSRP